MSAAPTTAPKRPRLSRRASRARRPWWRGPWLLLGTTVAIVAIVAVLLAIGLGGGAKPAASTGANAGGSELAPATVVDHATHPDPAALALVGAGGGGTTPVVGLPAGSPALASDGRPLIAYVGADYCPFCAGRRWSVVVALSRFGTFTNLGMTTSSSTDVYPDTPSFSFHGAGYSSPYMAFAGVETKTRDEQPLDKPSADVAGALARFDVPPYSSSPGAIPFLDIGGRFVSIGGGYNPGVLKGMSMEQIAAAIHDPNSPAGVAIMADANVITAAVCAVTGNQPADVCNAAPIPQILATLSRG